METPEADRERLGRMAYRLKLACQLHEDGVALMRQNLVRRHPDASAEEISARLRAWLHDRPPDAPGRPVSWPRTKT